MNIFKNLIDKFRNNRGHVITKIKGFPFDIVGESHYQDALERLAGGYRRDSQEIETTAKIVLDPKNKIDPNAVRVDIEGKTVGYLSRTDAQRVGKLMREQGVSVAQVDAQLRGGWRTNQHDVGYFGVRLRMPRSGWIDFGVGAEKPLSPSKKSVGRNKSHETENAAPTGPLSGQKIVLWGMQLDRDLEIEITSAGGKVMREIGKTTTMIVCRSTEITPGMRSSAMWKKYQNSKNSGRPINMITIDEMRNRLSNKDN